MILPNTWKKMFQTTNQMKVFSFLSIPGLSQFTSGDEQATRQQGFSQPFTPFRMKGYTFLWSGMAGGMIGMSE